MKVIICLNGGEVIPVMNDGEEIMSQFTSWDAARDWCNTSILGKASDCHIIDLESGDFEMVYNG